MLNRLRRSATWYRYILGAGAAIALTAVGAAAMWTGWLPSRPLQWNEINGRLNLGGSGAAIRGDRPIVVNQWPSAGSLSFQAKAEGGVFAGGERASFAERFARRTDIGERKAGALWGSDSRSRLSSTSGRSALGGGTGGHGGGLGTAGGVAPAQNAQHESSAKAAKAPAAPRSSGRPGSRGGGGGAPAPAGENTTTVGDLATGTTAGTGTLDLGFGPGDPGAGGGSGMAATPEPASIMLIGSGALAVAGLFRRRRK
jgi:hypothetical protein